MSDVKQLIRDQVAISTVARKYLMCRKQGGGWVAPCPWHNEKTPSLSINDHRKGYHCFGCGESGDVFTLTQKMEGCGFFEALNILARDHGFTHLLDSPAPFAGPPRRKRRKVWSPVEKPASKPDAAPAAVRKAWAEGVEDAGRVKKFASRIAERRGFELQTVLELVRLGKMSFPLLPWHEPGGHRATRGVAFRVESEGGWYGYHQLWFPQKGRKSWLFVPYPITEDRARTELQRKMIGCKSLPPVPFVVGDSALANEWIITEGQWDAITIWEALGRPGENSGIVIFGLRGAKSGRAFMDHYRKYLTQERSIQIVPDTDEAGSSLFRSTEHSTCLFDQLRNYTRHLRRVNIPPPFKDVNDWWRECSDFERDGLADALGLAKNKHGVG